MNNQLYQTPARTLNQKQYQHTKAESKIAESKYSYGNVQDQSRSNQEQQTLNDIENKIKEVGEQLKQIHDKMRQEHDQYSQNYLRLQQERKELRKQIIQLDYEHKMIFASKMRQSSKKVEVSQHSGMQQNSEKHNEQHQQNQKQGKEQSRIQNQLSQSRRRLRMAQIEAQLAESRLRRSRFMTLTSELDYLKYGYGYAPSYYSYIGTSLYPYSLGYSPYYGLSSRFWPY